MLLTDLHANIVVDIDLDDPTNMRNLMDRIFSDALEATELLRYSSKAMPDDWVGIHIRYKLNMIDRIEMLKRAAALLGISDLSNVLEKELRAFFGPIRYVTFSDENEKKAFFIKYNKSLRSFHASLATLYRSRYQGQM